MHMQITPASWKSAEHTAAPLQHTEQETSQKINVFEFNCNREVMKSVLGFNDLLKYKNNA